MRYPTVVACPLRSGPGVNLCGGRPRRCSSRAPAPCRWPASCGVSPKSAYQWRRRWRAGGEAALASAGPGGAECKPSEAQLARLRAELERGPAAHGWAEDQRWTLARVAALIG
jgi:hypothetical protein